MAPDLNEIVLPEDDGPACNADGVDCSLREGETLAFGAPVSLVDRATH